MASDRWRRIEELFLQAVEQPEDPPADSLERLLDGEDDEIRREVMSLIAANRSAAEVTAALRDDVERHAAAVRDAPEPDDPVAWTASGRAGERVGAYILDRPLGRGGMGLIYLAHRADGTYEGRVAVKILPIQALTKERAARFDRERRILAGLDHPNIARLLDAGSTSRGEPCFVMEYVDGVPLDTFCDQRRAPIGERLRLFLQVCRAVQHTHRKQVVHRDLKPANVLVTPDGSPKLLDFGIAKLLDEHASPEGSALTRTTSRPMTPSHASPEQIEGGEITTATDIYGLGVLLYQLLVGRLPYGDEAVVQRATQGCAPVAPSRACTKEAARDRSLDLQQLRRRLAGDLDVIVSKALEREPRRRYGSVTVLAADLERHLDGLPIAARRSTVGYRMSKLVGRHRPGFVASTAGTLVILGLSVALAEALALCRKVRGSDRPVKAWEKAGRPPRRDGRSPARAAEG